MNIDSSKSIVVPAFLVEADSYENGCKKVIHFLDETALVKYDSIEFDPDLSFSASDMNFWGIVDSGLEKNRKSMIGLIDELGKSGYSQLVELVEMKQGYETKILHILVHLLDGFIGIDSSFYNIIEDSHQISDSLHQKIKQSPEHYRLLQVNAQSSWTFL